jgi:ribonuclease Z
MVTHFTYDEDIDSELMAGIRAHYDGLFQYGVDVAVVNVTKDAIWYRKAVLPSKSGSVPPFREMAARAKKLGEPLPATFAFPNPRLTREDQQDKRWRDLEVDPHLYYPKEVYREQISSWPKDYSIDVAKILGAMKK